MKPTLEEYQRGATSWRGTHRGVQYELLHHGISEYYKEGTWCYYIHILEHEAADFDKFYRPDKIEKWFEASSNYTIKNYYYDIPDMGFHGGITFYENKPCLNYEAGEMSRLVKIGCDYAHLWDSEAGHPDDYTSVLFDCKRLIDAYLDNGYKISKDTK